MLNLLFSALSRRRVFLFAFQLDECANAIKGGSHPFLGGCHLACELHEAALGSGLATNNTCSLSPGLPTPWLPETLKMTQLAPNSLTTQLGTIALGLNYDASRPLVPSQQTLTREHTLTTTRASTHVAPVIKNLQRTPTGVVNDKVYDGTVAFDSTTAACPSWTRTRIGFSSILSEGTHRTLDWHSLG